MPDSLGLDLHERQLVRRPRPIGWFVAGLLAIATGGLLLGVYWPLHEAHGRLVLEHEALAVKAQELDHTLKNTRRQLERTEERRRALRSFVAEGAEQERSLAGRLKVVMATLERQLAPFIEAEHVAAKAQPGGIELSFRDGVLFRGQSSQVIASMTNTLCQSTESLGQQNDWLVTVSTRAAADDANYWATATERAANLASLLERACKLPPQRIVARSLGPLTGGQADEPSVTSFHLGPPEAPGLTASEAPTAGDPEEAATAEERPTGHAPAGDGTDSGPAGAARPDASPVQK